MPKPYPKEFRDDVVNVVRKHVRLGGPAVVGREAGQSIKQVATDLGIVESCLRNWMRAPDVEDGLKLGTSTAEDTELREAKKRIRQLTWIERTYHRPRPQHALG